MSNMCLRSYLQIPHFQTPTCLTHAVHYSKVIYCVKDEDSSREKFLSTLQAKRQNQKQHLKVP